MTEPRKARRRKTPTRKVTTATLSGAVATLIVWAVAASTGVDIPAPVGAAAATVTAACFAYFTDDQKGA